jgi:hypothetical protein
MDQAGVAAARCGEASQVEHAIRASLRHRLSNGCGVGQVAGEQRHGRRDWPERRTVLGPEQDASLVLGGQMVQQPRSDETGRPGDEHAQCERSFARLLGGGRHRSEARHVGVHHHMD